MTITRKPCANPQCRSTDRPIDTGSKLCVGCVSESSELPTAQVVPLRPQRERREDAR